MAPQTFDELRNTLDMIKVRRVVLLYLSEKLSPNNFTDLQKEFIKADSSKCGILTTQEFSNCFSRANMQLLPRELDELTNELGM
jgi:Ca2+-binding EF-hand superfamily protein